MGKAPCAVLSGIRRKGGAEYRSVFLHAVPGAKAEAVILWGFARRAIIFLRRGHCEKGRPCV